MGERVLREREVLDVGRVALFVAGLIVLTVAVYYVSGSSPPQTIESFFEYPMPLSGLREFLSLNQTAQVFNVLIHGGNGSIGYWSLSAVNLTDPQITNATLTNYTCLGNNCNFTIFLDNDNSTSQAGALAVSSGTVNQVYYIAPDGSLRNVSELGQIGQGNFSFSSSWLNYTLAGGDGYDYGIRDSRPGGSYWLNQNGTLFGNINISNDFITVELTENGTKIYNSSGKVIFNSSFDYAAKVDNVPLNLLYGYGTQNKTVYFFDWSSQTWKIWQRNVSNSTHGVPDWLDPRNKQAFKWRYSFSNSTAQSRPGVNMTFLMTAADPFVRMFVDTVNATNLDNITIPISLGENKTSVTTTQNKTGSYFFTSGGALEQLLFATQNFKNGTHAFNYTVPSNSQIRYDYTFNSTMNSNFLFVLGTGGTINTTGFDPQKNATQFSSETIESVANSTMTWYDLVNHQTTTTISYTSNGTYDFVVPVGVTSIEVSVWGAGGTSAQASGGKGGFVKGRMWVVPGQSYKVVVGSPTGGGTGGGGGGAGGAGGGYSGVFIDSVSHGNAKIIAGAGGGGGGSLEGELSQKGSDGGPNGGNGTGAGGWYGFCSGGGGGQGGTQTSGGAGGSGGTYWFHGHDGVSGSSGSALTGGAGGWGWGGGGGGGGSGYYGGGGGGGGAEGGDYEWVSCSGGGGGGGSNYLSPGTLVISNSTWSSSDPTWAYPAGMIGSPGRVVISYTTTGLLYSDHSGWTNFSFLPSFNYDGGALGIWHFDEGSGLNATDSSGNGNTGTLIDGPKWISNSSCKFGSCLSFDGVNDKVTVKRASSLEPAQLTVSAWFKTSASGINRIVTKPFTAGARASYTLFVDIDNLLHGRLDFSADPLADTASISTVNDGNWHHGVVTYDGSNLKLYLDGTLQRTTAETRTIPYSSLNLFISSFDGSIQFFNGTIDEVRIYPRALSESEIREHYQREVSKYYDDFSTAASGKTYRYFGVEDSNTTLQPVTPAGTVLHYRFNDNSTLKVSDSSGSGNGGTATNGPIWLTNSSCKFGGCMSFDGVNDYVDSGSLASGPSGTMAVWIKPGGTYSGTQVIMGGANSAGADVTTRYTLGARNTGVCSGGDWYTVIANGASSQYICSGQVYDQTNFPPNVWTHVLITYDGSNVRFYRNGSLIRTVAQTVSGAGSAQPFSIGRAGAYAGGYFSGSVDEVLVINRSLSSDEIYQLYLGGVNRTVNGNWHRIASADGLSSVSFNLTDKDNPYQRDYDQRQFVFSVTTLDSTPPTITVQSPGNATYSDTSVWANITLDEVGSVALRSLDGGPNVSMSNSSGNWNNLMSGLTDGTHSVIFYANDTSGNTASSTVFFTVSAVPNVTLQINKTFNPLIPWWVEYVNISGYVSYTNGTPFSGTVVVNETNPGKPEGTICQLSLSPSGSFYCNFTSKYQVTDTVIWVYAKSGGYIVANSSGLLETKPNYGQRPLGPTPRSVLETPLTIQEPSSIIRTIITRLVISRGTPT